MKKSGAVKHPDTGSLCTTTSRRQVEWAGKPDPIILPTNQSPVSAKMDTARGYEKSRTSSGAKKEGAQMRSRSPQNSSASGLKLTRTLTRVLTKTPSFKHTRATANKRSSVVRCENLKGQRATCCSTLKDHKFPAYLALNTGATRAEGPFATKVCSYTYCSLSGHRDDPLPSLKYFLSARRNVMKSQRSIARECPSPHQTRPHKNITKETEAERINLVEKPSTQGCSSGSAPAPLIQEEDAAGFFTGNKSKGSEDDCQHDEDSTLSSSIGDIDETRRGNEREIDSLERADLSRGITCLAVDVAAEVYPPSQMNCMRNSIKAYSSGDNSLLREIILRQDKTAGGNSVEDLADEIVQEVYHAEPVSEAWSTDTGITESYEDSGSDTFLSSESSSHKWFASDGANNRPDEYMDAAIAAVNSAPVERAAKKKAGEEASEPEAETLSMGTQKMNCDIGSKRYEYSCGMYANLDVVPKKFVDSEKDYEDHQPETLTSSKATAEKDEPNKTLVTETFINQSEDFSSVNHSASSRDIPNSEAEESIRAIETTKPDETELAENELCENFAKKCRITEDNKQAMKFNLKAPNLLPLEPYQEAEKVDLKHHVLEKKKKTDEWMVDHALQQVVSKLGSARSRKVELLVEAFETVLPFPKREQLD